jgi:hypothetical protein
VTTLAVLPLVAAGRMAVHTTVGTHVIIDVRGWFTSLSAPLSGRGVFVAAVPSRFLDTRSSGATTTLREVAVARRNAMPACPSGVVGTVTVIPAATASVQVGPWGGFRAGAWSNVSADRAGVPVKNSIMVATSTSPAHDLGVAPSRPAQVVLDLSGWFV